MFFKAETKEQRKEIAGIAVMNGQKAEPARRKKKKGSGYEYGVLVTEVTGDYSEVEEED